MDGAVLTFSLLSLPLDTQNSAFVIFAEMVLSSLMPASPENFLRATLSCQNIAYQDVFLNIILSLRVEFTLH